MTRIFATIAFLLFLIPVAKAQTTNFVNGYVVTVEGDTIQGLLKMYRYSAKPSSVAIFMDEAGKKTKYKPKDLKAYKVGTHHYVSQSYYRPVTGNTLNAFMKVEIEGPLTLYTYFFVQSGAPMGPDGMMTGSSVQTSYFLQKAGQPLHFVKKMKFRKEISEYLSDSETTVMAINEEKMKYADIKKIVKMYNDDAGINVQ